MRFAFLCVVIAPIALAAQAPLPPNGVTMRITTVSESVYEGLLDHSNSSEILLRSPSSNTRSMPLIPWSEVRLLEVQRERLPGGRKVEAAGILGFALGALIGFYGAPDSGFAFVATTPLLGIIGAYSGVLYERSTRGHRWESIPISAK